MNQPDRYAVELVIFGLLDALVKSKAVEVNILEHHLLAPLFSVTCKRTNPIRIRRIVSKNGLGTAKSPSPA